MFASWKLVIKIRPPRANRRSQHVGIHLLDEDGASSSEKAHYFDLGMWLRLHAPWFHPFARVKAGVLLVLAATATMTLCFEQPAARLGPDPYGLWLIGSKLPGVENRVSLLLFLQQWGCADG